MALGKGRGGSALRLEVEVHPLLQVERWFDFHRWDKSFRIWEFKVLSLLRSDIHNPWLQDPNISFAWLIGFTSTKESSKPKPVWIDGEITEISAIIKDLKWILSYPF